MTDRPHPDLDAPLSEAEAAEVERVTGLDLDEIERRANAATPGPWTQELDRPGDEPSRWITNRWDIADPDAIQLVIAVEEHQGAAADAAFIAASRTDVPALVAEVRRLRAVLNEAESLLDCTEFALDWLILRHVIADGGKDWRSKFDGSAFFACDCSENGGYMDYDVNAYEHTERCASGFEDSLPALYDQIKALRPRARAALAGGPSIGEAR